MVPVSKNGLNVGKAQRRNLQPVKNVFWEVFLCDKRSSVLRPYSSAGAVYVNLSDITSRSRLVATMVTSGLQKKIRIQSVGTFVIYQLTKFHSPRSSVPLVAFP